MGRLAVRDAIETRDASPFFDAGARAALAKAVVTLLWLFTIYEGGAVVLHEWREHAAGRPDIHLGERISIWDRNHIELTSWASDPVDFRWALGDHSSITFWQHTAFRTGESCQLDLHVVAPVAPQRVDISMNGVAASGLQVNAAGDYQDRKSVV